MQTIRLQVSDHIFENLLKSLNSIAGKDVQIIHESKEFLNNVAEVNEDYRKMKNGESEMIDFEEFEKSISQIL